MPQYPAGAAIPASKAVTKVNTAGARPFYTNDTFVTGDNAYSAWAQMTASLSADNLFTGISYSQTGTNISLGGPIMIDIGIGGAGAETTLTTVILSGRSIDSGNQYIVGGYQELAPWLHVAAGQRVAVRARAGSNGSGVYGSLNVFSVPYSNLEGN